MSEHLSWETLNDLADGALSNGARSAAGAHVALCGECRLQLSQLQALARRADAATDEIDPPNVWNGIRDRIVAGTKDTPVVASDEPRVLGHISAAPLAGAKRRVSVSTPWLAAAALVLVAGSSAVTAWIVRSQDRSSVATAALPAVLRAASLPVDIQASEEEYLKTAQALRDALDEERSRLAPETIAIVERSLTVIEGAIGEAREALIRDPANRELRDVWSRNHQQKLDLLRRAASLVQKT